MDKDVFFESARNDLTGPLDGLRVLECTTAWAGPMAGCVLADLGAEVIKIEHPAGEMARSIGPFVPGESKLSLMNETVNRNKLSLSLNMKEPEGRDIILELAKSADVFLQNFKPGTLAGWGLGYEDIKRVKEDIVYTSVSGFGQFGPHHERAGYDPLVQAQSGWMSLNGEIDGGPIKAPTFIGDDLGGLHGALATLAALRHRDVNGEGQHLDISLMDSIFSACNMFPSLAKLGEDFDRMGNEFSTTAPFNVYECKDGYVYLGMSLDRHWKHLLELMDHEQLLDDARFSSMAARLENREAVDSLVANWCRSNTQNYVVDSCGEKGLPVAPVNTFQESVMDPNTEERGALQQVELSDGTQVPLLGPTAKFSRTPTRIRNAAPPLGDHNEQLLGELGLSTEQLVGLKDRGII